ncbi:speckle-type POZ protein-like [Paramacrobiotus metropolitanus]|uniref:speckle-type POZ protein-like n=1 Tax=Paramacrobiotus metropolitanus TaxID=2943436 RepID=UPI002445639A|nr:speckle-type POZ protein-like [Paramacrobiotus metropolitanus]
MDEEVKSLGVFLALTDDDCTRFTGQQEISAEFDLSVYSGKATSTLLQKGSTKATFTKKLTEVGFDKLVLHTQLFDAEDNSKTLRDDYITITANVLMYTKPNIVRLPETANSLKRRQTFAANHLQRQANLFASEKHAFATDFILYSNDGQEFRTSRFLLMAHSPVFAAMLTHDLQEKQQSLCKLADVDPECVEILLDFLYGCGVDKITAANAEKALIMADKYQMADLRRACEDVLLDSVNSETAVRYLILAHQRGLDVLKEVALGVIPKNMKNVLTAKNLEEVLQSHPDVVELIMEHCSKRMRTANE